MAKKNKALSILIWGGIIVLLLLLGVGGAFFYFYPGILDSESPMQTASEIFGDLTSSSESEPEQEGQEGPLPPGARSHVVQEGENLWAIARKGKLVDNPWEWRTIVVQNKDKIDYTFISEDTGAWKVVMEEGQELRVQPEPPREQTGPVKKKYALQLLSLPEKRFKEAMKIVKTLLSGGTYAYLYRAEVKGKKMLRIRAGFYETKAQAGRSEKRIHARLAGKNLLPEKFFIVVPSDRELRGELLDFGIQRASPWAIEMPHRDSHQKALEDLRQVSPESSFAYIAQKKGFPSGVFVYRVRVGFFTTKNEAKSFLESRAEAGGVWKKAKITRIKTFAETLPGQRIKVNKPESM